MIFEELEKWRLKQSPCILLNEIDEDNFSSFYQEQNCGKTFFEMMSALAYEIYELQVCVDGLIQELDND